MSNITEELFSEQSERVLLSILLNNPDKLTECYDLTPKMFSSVPNRLIYSTISDLHMENLSPNDVLIIESLRSKEMLDTAGGERYIESLADLETSASNYKQYLNLVKDAYKARSILSLGSKIPEFIKQTKDVNSVLNAVKNAITDLMAGSGGELTASIKDVATAQWEQIEKRVATVGITGMRTGFTSLDNALNGVESGYLVVIAGRPSQGKTAWVCSSMLNCDYPSLIFSKEMGATMLLDRMISAESGVPFSKVRQGSFKDAEELDKVKDAVDKLKGKDIFIDSNFSADISYVLNSIRKYHQQHGVKFVYLDYVQLMVERDENATHEIGRVSRALKLLANELDIVVFLVSQLNRSVEMRENKRPILSDLRQSGNLEEDADMVIFLYRDEYYNTDSKDRGVIENIIRKNRNGPIGTVYMEFLPETVSVIDKKRKKEHD
jgi:replicative DNA helicase